MTAKTYMTRRAKYIEKIEYYRKKLLALDDYFFWESNKGNEFLKRFKKEKENERTAD